MITVDMIYEYEKVLNGIKLSISPFFFGKTDEAKENAALDLIRFAIKVYLKWDAETVRTYLSWDILNELCLDSVKKYIKFAPEASPDDELRTLIEKLYPYATKSTFIDRTKSVYEDVLNGVITKFPKGFFQENKGEYRAKICFMEMLYRSESIYTDIEELYEEFSSNEGIKKLKKHKLYTAYTQLFETPLDFLHQSLPPAYKSDFYFKYYKFKYIQERTA